MSVTDDEAKHFLQQQNRHMQARRALLMGAAGVGAGALATLANVQRAEADTAFTNFAFPGTGFPSSRTMPARIADRINVKEFGATGDGVTDDSNAIQAAIDFGTASYTTGYIGTIYFPKGNYKVTKTIGLPPGLPSKYRANFTGVISAGGVLTVTNWSGPSQIVVNSKLSSYAYTPFSIGNTSIASFGTGTGQNGTYNLSPNPGAFASAAMQTNQAVVANPSFRIVGDAWGTNIFGNFPGYIFDCSGGDATANNTGGLYFEGLRVANSDPTPFTSGAFQLAGAANINVIGCAANGMVGFSTYDNTNNARNVNFIGCFYQGGPKNPPYASSDNIGWLCCGNTHQWIGCEGAAGGNLGVVYSGIGGAMLGCHFEDHVTAVLLGLFGDLTFEFGATMFSLIELQTEGCGIGVDCANVGASYFQNLYLIGEGGTVPGGTNSLYGFRSRDGKMNRSILDGVYGTGVFDNFGVYLGDASLGSRPTNRVTGIAANPTTLANDIRWPTGAGQAVSYAGFIGNTSTGTHALPAWTFSTLPSGGDVADGDQYDIVDGLAAQCSDGTCTTLGTNVNAGGGALHLRVRWNAAKSKWTLMGA